MCLWQVSSCLINDSFLLWLLRAVSSGGRMQPDDTDLWPELRVIRYRSLSGLSCQLSRRLQPTHDTVWPAAQHLTCRHYQLSPCAGKQDERAHVMWCLFWCLWVMNSAPQLCHSPALLKLRNPFVIVGCLHWGTCPGVQVSETGQDIVSVVMLGHHHPTISTWHRHLVGDFNDSSRLFGGLCIIYWWYTTPDIKQNMSVSSLDLKMWQLRHHPPWYIP